MGVVTPGAPPEEQTLEAGPNPPTPHLLPRAPSSGTRECQVLDGYHPETGSHSKARPGILGAPIPTARERLLSHQAPQQQAPQQQAPLQAQPSCREPAAPGELLGTGWALSPGRKTGVTRGGPGSPGAGSTPACATHPWACSGLGAGRA